TSRLPGSVRSRRRRRRGSTTAPPSESRCVSATCTRGSNCSHGAASPRRTCATGSRARRGSRTASTASRFTISSPACRFSALHELAANLYNHATMATPTTQPSDPASDAGSLSAGIAGASGYAGRELARLLAGHPQLSLQTAQARSEGFDALSPQTLARCDVAFLCLPHGASRPFGEAIASAGTAVVDLGSDFRLDPD